MQSHRPGLIFGHFSAKSTQLELAVFEFFLEFGLSFFKILLVFWVFFTKNTLSFFWQRYLFNGIYDFYEYVIRNELWTFIENSCYFVNYRFSRVLKKFFCWLSGNCTLVELADFEFFGDLPWVFSGFGLSFEFFWVWVFFQNVQK